MNWLRSSAILALPILLAACASKSPAPVLERRPSAAVPPPAVVTAPPAPGPASRPAGRDSAAATYTVKKGDTLFAIALDHGQDYRDLVKWNNLENANLIRIDQVLRVVPPEGEQAGSRAGAAPDSQTAAIQPGAVQSRPIEPAPKADAGTTSEEPISWSWPGTGRVIEEFSEAKNKGIDLEGKAGDPVLASADGKVVYSGSGLRGYGNLVIVKHDNMFLSAYAHNRMLLAKEGQAVKRGQKIAEMGNSDSDKVKLHFEVRRQGKPVDPMKYLPAR